MDVNSSTLHVFMFADDFSHHQSTFSPAAVAQELSAGLIKQE